MEVGGELHAPAVLPPDRNPRYPLSHCRCIAITICTSALDHTISGEGGGRKRLLNFRECVERFDQRLDGNRDY